MVPWQPTLNATTLVRQLEQLDPDREDDEDSHPSEPDADRLCYYKGVHNERPPPGPIKVRFTSGCR